MRESQSPTPYILPGGEGGEERRGGRGADSPYDRLCGKSPPESGPSFYSGIGKGTRKWNF